MSNQPTIEYLTDRELAARYKVSRNAIWTWTKNGKLPKPVKLSTNCTRWIRSEVEAVERAWRGGAR